MATTSHFQTQKSFFVVLFITLTSFLMLLNKVAAESTSFTFNNFVPNQQNLILQGNALVTSKGMLQLTKVKDSKPIYDSLGRALYSAPVHIWDNKTGNVASFATAFTFVIKAPVKAKTADGLAFFLAPVNTQPQKAGGLLGLFPDRSYNKSSQTVAVEFDTFYNQDWDPEGPHIGIDVNSIKSRKTTPWDLANGEVAVVIISYLAPTKSLTVSLVYPLLETSFILDATVDLKAVLPEWVRVGFSASTGLSEDYVETHDVLSWSFQSELPDSTSDALQNKAHLSTYVLPA